MRGQPLIVDLTIQPILGVTFYMLDGDFLYAGTRASTQITIHDLTGEPFDPSGSIEFDVFIVTANIPAATAKASGVASQVELEGLPLSGEYLIAFDTSQLIDVATVYPLQCLVRVSIPFDESVVVQQKTFQLRSLNDLS